MSKKLFDKVQNDGLPRSVDQDPDDWKVLNEPGCGKPEILKRRIFGSQDAGFGANPWDANVKIVFNGNWLESASWYNGNVFILVMINLLYLQNSHF